MPPMATASFSFERVGRFLTTAKWLRRGVGITLVVGAAWWAAASWPQGVRFRADALGFAVAVAFGNLVATAMLHRSVVGGIGSRPRVGRAEMVGVTAMSGVLNYLPAPRAGLVGRAVYLKAVHGYSLLDSTRATVAILALGVLVTALPGAVLLLTTLTGARTVTAWMGLTASLALAAWLAPRLAERLLAAPIRLTWNWVLWRAIDLALGATRMWLCLYAVGAQIDLITAVTLAAGWALVKMTAITPQGLGVAEWALIGLAAVQADLPAGAMASAALLDRFVEAVALGAGALLLGKGKLVREPRVAPLEADAAQPFSFRPRPDGDRSPH
ncbi:MAG: hypothetical protein AAF288_08965 [Planctomycetota bacterium]